VSDAPSPRSREQAIAAIRRVVGPAGCVDAPDAMEPYLTDFRGLHHGHAALIALPATTAEVSAILAICNESGIGVVPHGGNTSYCGGATPHEAGNEIVLGLRRMNRVRQVDPLNFSMIVEAGCLLEDVQTAAGSVDRYFPLALGSQGSCQIGGNIATNAGGLAAVHYGVTRDLVLGLEVVLADGRVLDGLTSLRKDNTGYDLRDLFVGAEGTLGVVTAASLKLFPRLRTVETAFIAVPDAAAAVQLLGRVRAATGDCVTTFEYLPHIAVEFVERHIPGASNPLGKPYPAYVLCEVSTARDDRELRRILEDALGTALADGLCADVTLAASMAQRDALWKLRESVPEAQRHEGGSIKHDIAVPVAALPEFLVQAAALVQRIAPEGRLVAYGHVGDGNLHFNVSEPAGGGDPVSFRALEPRISAAVYALVEQFHGSISAEHGIGQLKRAELARHKAAVDLDLMRRIKRALDPNGIMNPGKVLPD
jgi:FAD/FMN-containing dehydrogenase